MGNVCRQAPLAAAAVSLLCGAGPFDGMYQQSTARICAPLGVDGGAIRLADGVFEGVDARCAMSNPVNVRDMDAVLYDLRCEAEDTAWIQRMMAMRAADGGLFLVWNGYAFKYNRCAPPGVAEPTP